MAINKLKFDVNAAKAFITVSIMVTILYTRNQVTG